MDAGRFVYILASKYRGALFVGATEDLEHCVSEHRLNQVDGLTSLYAIHRLVYYEYFDACGPALQREVDLRHLPRCEKLRLVESVNPAWRDLYDEIEPVELTPA